MKKRELIQEAMNIKDPKLRDLLLNPLTHLAGYEMVWNKTHNPFWVWIGVEHCIEENLGYFPPWVTDYLMDVALRMRSPEAKESKDLRKVLPWIVGFPPKAERRGHALREGQSDEQMRFAEEFSSEIEKGAKPTDALHNACSVLLIDKADDKTLRGWVKEYFELTSWPRSNAEWRAVILSQMKMLYGHFRAKIRESPP
jgi:hypothetical protein